MRLNETLAYLYLQLKLEGELEAPDGCYLTPEEISDKLGLLIPATTYFELMLNRIGFSIDETNFLHGNRTNQEISEFYANIYKGIRL